MKIFLSLLLLLYLAQAPAQTVITTGGTYSGIFQSTSPGVAVITVNTDQAVIITNAVVIGQGNLIIVTGSAGANVTVTNTTGICYDPHVAGQQRGQFIQASMVNSIDVEQTTNLGCSFGIGVYNSPNVTFLKITNNYGGFAEDRVSSGTGWVTSPRPNLGHFVFLASIVLPNGGEIGWNRFVCTVGLCSIEDAYNIYRSQGTAAHPISVHDNYSEGQSTPSNTSNTGTCFIADGATSAPYTAYTLFQGNSCVHGSSSGYAIASGHDNTMQNNRVVSCGQDGAGNWIMASFAQGGLISNYYSIPGASFYNNTITGMVGGLVRPASDGTPLLTDIYKDPGLGASNAITGNSFTDPCMVGGVVSLAAEAAERTYWASKVATAGQTIGDQHLY